MTGVQTCALPISRADGEKHGLCHSAVDHGGGRGGEGGDSALVAGGDGVVAYDMDDWIPTPVAFEKRGPHLPICITSLIASIDSA